MDAMRCITLTFLLLGTVSTGLIIERRQFMFGRPVDFMNTTILKQLTTGKSSPTGATVLNGRIYIVYDTEKYLSVFDAKTFAKLADIQLAFVDDKVAWERDILSCPDNGGALFVTEKSEKKGVRIWKIVGKTESLWLEEPLQEVGIQDVSTSGTGCGLIVTRIYEKDRGTVTLYFGNATVDRKLTFEPSYVFPIQSFDSKRRTFMMTTGPTSRHVAVEMNQNGDVIRSLPRDEENRNLAKLNFASLATFDNNGNVFVIDGNDKSLTVIDEDLSHSRQLFKSDVQRSCAYYDTENSRLILCNPGTAPGVDVYAVKYPSDEE